MSEKENRALSPSGPLMQLYRAPLGFKTAGCVALRALLWRWVWASTLVA